jgi:hypothetical protein
MTWEGKTESNEELYIRMISWCMTWCYCQDRACLAPVLRATMFETWMENFLVVIMKDSE